MIKEMPNQERPRQKGIKYGVRTLSNRELLAILLRTGTNEKSVLEVADELLERSGGISGLPKMSMNEIMGVKGIAQVKALEIMACFELSRRTTLEHVEDQDVVYDPHSLVTWLQREIGSELQEHFLAVYLDTKNKIITYRDLFKGTIDASMVVPREVFKEALLLNSTSIMLVHNHPSGDPTPSMADMALTERLVEAGKLMGIQVIDHLVISQNRYLSFAHEGLL